MQPIRRTNLSRRTRSAASQRYIRASQTDEQREARNEVERNRWNRNQQRRNVAFNRHRAAFNYNVAIHYSSQQIVAIGPMNVVLCQWPSQIDAIDTATRATTFIGFRIWARFYAFFDSYSAIQ
jgi:DNA-binding MarR family transcriptional regulator